MGSRRAGFAGTSDLILDLPDCTCEEPGLFLRVGRNERRARSSTAARSLSEGNTNTAAALRSRVEEGAARLSDLQRIFLPAVPQTSSRPRSTMSRQQQQQQQRTSFRLSDNLVEVKSKVSDGLLTDAVSDAGCALSGPQPSALLIQIVM